MQELYDLIFSLPPKQFTLVGVILGFLLIDDLSPAKQNSLGNFIILIGQIIEASSAQAQVIQNMINTKQNNDMIQDLNKIKNMLNL